VVPDRGASPVLACRSLTKSYGDRVVVDDVSFSIAAGETYGLLGPNGAGKTTTISMVCGLLRRDGGEVTVAGEPLDDRSVAAKGHLGLVPQELALYPDLTARENLAFFGRLQGLRGSHLDGRITTVLDIIGLADRADERIDTFSGGMKRRCNIGAGLLHEPELLILDEPTVGVDPQSRNAILEAIETLGGAGLAVLYTTHYMEEADRLCDRVGIIDEGRLVAEGTRRELVAHLGERTRIRLAAAGDLGVFSAAAAELDGVSGADVADGGVDLLASDGTRVLAPLVELAEHHGLVLSGVEVAEPDLEAVFLHLTGKALRD
jgi:ABC-2 type transport system ATP-binding protein